MCVDWLLKCEGKIFGCCHLKNAHVFNGIRSEFITEWILDVFILYIENVHKD